MLSPGLVVVQKLSHAQLSVTPWTVALQASLTFTISQSLLKLMTIESVMPSNPLILCRPFSSCPQSFPASGSFPMSLQSVSDGQILELQLQHQSFQWIFKVDWFDLFAVQGTLRSLLQHHSLEASILQHSTFFMVQLSYSYMTTGKIIALTTWTFVGKVIFLLFNMLSRFVTAFLPRSKCLLISWLQSPSHAWSPKNSHQLKHNIQLLGCDNFLSWHLHQYMWRRPQFDPSIRKIPWKMEWLPIPVFLPKKFHGQRTLVGYSTWSLRVGHNWVTLSLLLNFCSPLEQSPMTGLKRYNRDSKMFEQVNKKMRGWNCISPQENLQQDQALPFSKNQVNRNHVIYLSADVDIRTLSCKVVLTSIIFKNFVI